MISQYGFPPIRYCDIKITDNKISKERYFANTKIKTFNIRKILSDEKKTPIIISDNTEDNIEITNVI